MADQRAASAPLPENVLHEFLVDLLDHFGEFDDGEPAMFGEFARVSKFDNVLYVRHETEPWGFRLTVEVVTDDD